MIDDMLRISAADTELLLRHYAEAGPLIERFLRGIPFVWATLPKGVGSPPYYHGPLSDKTRPKAATVDVPLADGLHRYAALSADRIEGLVRYGAVEVHSWTPTAEDPTRVRFARLLVEGTAQTPRPTLAAAVSAMATIFRDEDGLGGVLVTDGGTDIAMWIPFADAPAYEPVRAWLHQRCTLAVSRHPELFSIEPNTHGGTVAHLHVQTNAVGRFTALPYSARARQGYPVAVPVRWNDIASFLDVRVPAGELQAWLQQIREREGAAFSAGEYFAEAVTQYGAQRFGDRAKVTPRVFAATSVPNVMPSRKARGPIITATLAVLQDGHSRTAEEILTLAEQRGLLDGTVTKKYVYTALIEYIARTNGNGRKPLIVQNADRSFRVNEPPDAWPPFDNTTTVPVVSPTIQTIIDRLDATVNGADAAAFESAVCDAFGALGFAATHMGGEKAPDGYADALLGPLGYRTMIECKSGDEGKDDPSVFEASKYRDAFGAQFCALVARDYSGETEVVKELQNHAVSAWTVDDLQMLLRIGSNPLEMKPLFAPGFAADALDDLLWERQHGRTKRIRIIADALVRTGWTTQSAYRGLPSDAPRLTEDVAMVLVDQDLAAEGSSATCNREDVQAAFAYLANPLVHRVERNEPDGSIVVLSEG